jgi:hypothetical protein
MGAKAAEVDRQSTRRVFADTQLVFLCCGMGGGTGTGVNNSSCTDSKGAGCNSSCNGNISI